MFSSNFLCFFLWLSTKNSGGTRPKRRIQWSHPSHGNHRHGGLWAFFSGLMKHFFLRPKQYNNQQDIKGKKMIKLRSKRSRVDWKDGFDDWQGWTETSCQSLQHFGRQCCRPFYRFRCWSKRLHHAAGGTSLRPISLETGGNTTQK